jgi:hypothetical protein
VTVTGMTVGAATAGGSVTVQTSADVLPSNAVSSGAVGGAVILSSFIISAVDIFAGQMPVNAIVIFTTTAGGAIGNGGSLTISFPVGFFIANSSAVLNALINSQRVTGTFSGSSSFVFPVQTGIPVVSSGTSVVVVVAGLTLGAATSGGSVTVQTSADVLMSNVIQSGRINAPPSNPTPASDSNSNGVLPAGSVAVSGGGIAGIVIGCFVASILIVIAFYRYQSAILRFLRRGFRIGRPGTGDQHQMVFLGVFECMKPLHALFASQVLQVNIAFTDPVSTSSAGIIQVRIFHTLLLCIKCTAFRFVDNLIFYIQNQHADL